MKLFIFLLSGYISAARYHHFSEQLDKTIRPKGDLTKCLTLLPGRNIRFQDCEAVIDPKQQWYTEIGNYFGRRYRSVHFAQTQGKSMCVTVKNNNKAKKVSRCKNKSIRGGWPRQLFDMLGDEDQLSIPRDDGSKRDCLSVNSVTGVLSLGGCDASVCNNGRSSGYKCASCAWRYGLQAKCDYCENSSHVLTNDGDCIDINSVSKCTEKYPISHTMRSLKWYHLQGKTFCTKCDPNDESKCLRDACPQQYATGEWYDGKCRCPQSSSAIYAQSGGPYVAYTGCISDAVGKIWENYEEGKNWNCKSNSFQSAPESKCNKCMWYMQYYCSSCVTKGAEVFIGRPGNRMYCVCPAGFEYNASADRCKKV